MVSAGRAVILLEPFTNGMRRDSDDRVALGIEIGGTAEGFDRDAVLLDGLGRAGEVLLAHETEEAYRVTAPAEEGGA